MSDELLLCAHAQKTLVRRGTRKDVETVLLLCKQHQTTRVVVGLPYDCEGNEGQGAKRATWGVMREGLPKGVFLGWKNFKDEDFPMLTVAQTMAQVKPTPNFVSYQ